MVIPYYVPSSYGGPPVVVHEFARRLVARGHEVAVVTTDSAGGASRGVRRETRDGVRIDRCRVLAPRFASRHKVFLAPGFGPAMRRALRGADIVHIHELRSLQAWQAGRLAARRGIPVFVSPHGKAERLFRKLRLKAAFDTLVGRPLLRKAAAIVCLTEAERREVAALGVPTDRAVIVPNGVALPAAGPAPGRTARDGPIRIVSVARLNLEKGQDIMVEAAALLKEQGTAVRLQLAGPDDGFRGRIEDAIQRQGVQDVVTVLGEVADQVRDGLVREADLFLSASRKEGLPGAVLEALASGVPCIVTPACNLPEVEAGGAGFVASDAQGIVRAVQAYAALGPPARDEMREGARTVARGFSWPAAVERLEAAYLAALRPAPEGHR